MTSPSSCSPQGQADSASISSQPTLSSSMTLIGTHKMMPKPWTEPTESGKPNLSTSTKWSPNTPSNKECSKSKSINLSGINLSFKKAPSWTSKTMMYSQALTTKKLPTWKKDKSSKYKPEKTTPPSIKLLKWDKQKTTKNTIKSSKKSSNKSKNKKILKILTPILLMIKNFVMKRETDSWKIMKVNKSEKAENKKMNWISRTKSVQSQLFAIHSTFLNIIWSLSQKSIKNCIGRSKKREERSSPLMMKMQKVKLKWNKLVN